MCLLVLVLNFIMVMLVLDQMVLSLWPLGQIQPMECVIWWSPWVLEFGSLGVVATISAPTAKFLDL